MNQADIVVAALPLSGFAPRAVGLAKREKSPALLLFDAARYVPFIMSRAALLVSRQLEAALVRRPFRLDRTLLQDQTRVPSGFVPFSTPSGKLFGNFLLDDSMSFPVQVRCSLACVFVFAYFPYFQHIFHCAKPPHLTITLSSPGIQVVNYASEPTDFDRKYIESALSAAWRRRCELGLSGALDLSARSAFRLVHEIFDGLPGLGIDILGSYALIHVYSRHWLPELSAIASWILHESHASWERPLLGIYVADHIRDELHRRAQEQGGIPQLQRCIAGHAAPRHSTTILEDGLIYHVALANGSATGLYLDQRDNRRKLAQLLQQLPSSSTARPRSMLSVYSYAASFSLAAISAVSGLQTVNLDPSHAAAEVAERNFQANGIDPANHRFQKKDPFASMSALDNTGAQFDLVVLDPPSVSRVRRPDGKLFTFSTTTNYDELVSLAAPLVAPGGYLVTLMSTRSLDTAKWEKMIQQGMASIVDRKKEFYEFSKFADERKRLRKRNDLRKKPRDRMLQKMATDGKFEISREDVEKMFSFEKVDQWGQTPDFGWQPSDSFGQYLHGLVWKRSPYLPAGLILPAAAPLAPRAATTPRDRPRPRGPAPSAPKKHRPRPNNVPSEKSPTN